MYIISVKNLVDDKEELSAYLTGMNTTISIWLGNNSFQNNNIPVPAS